MAKKLVLLTTTGAGTWTVPTDWVDPGSQIICIGGGGGGGRAAINTTAGSAGGGGAWSTVSTLGLAAGATVYINVGAGGAGGAANNTDGVSGGDTWLNKAANSAPTLTTQGALAKGGVGGAALSTGGGGGGGAGGASASGVGTTKYSGGTGGGGGFAARSAGGGGGAAGSGVPPGWTAHAQWFDCRAFAGYPRSGRWRARGRCADGNRANTGSKGQDGTSSPPRRSVILWAY